MFCLFRNSHIHPRLNRYVILLSLLGVIGWLYFTIIEKSLVTMLKSGDALIVDLVFGLPLVLMMGVVIYATIYWTCKILIIIALPKFIVPAEPEGDVLQEQLEEDNIQTLEEQHGSEYWAEDDSHSELDSSKDEQKAADEVK
ncbi:MAG: hypothetical protein PF440_07610 [Thiomicrorhabdus sp.]|jgi:hypothetical protein|nr:hypothetical protein [Thiomicrorhabdus sp.]